MGYPPVCGGNRQNGEESNRILGVSMYCEPGPLKRVGRGYIEGTG